MKTPVNLIFPNHLFERGQLVDNGHPVYLIEEYLFFRHYKFHKQKIAFHRASMKCYQDYLERRGIEVFYIESSDSHSDIRELVAHLALQGIQNSNAVPAAFYEASTGVEATDNNRRDEFRKANLRIFFCAAAGHGIDRCPLIIPSSQLFGEHEPICKHQQLYLENERL